MNILLENIRFMTQYIDIILPSRVIALLFIQCVQYEKSKGIKLLQNNPHRHHVLYITVI